MAEDIDLMLQEIEGYGAANDSENARQVLEALEAMGDIRPAEAQELERLRAAAPANQQAIGQTNATYRGALQGVTFRNADEIYGMFGGDVDAARDKNRAAQEQFPKSYGLGEGVGAAGTGVLAALLTRGRSAPTTLKGMVGQGAVFGGVEGGAWGLGTGEGAGNKFDEALRSGSIGAGIGAAAVPVAAGLVGTGRAIGGLFNRGNQARADRALSRTLAKSGRDADDVSQAVTSAAAEGQPEYRLMDALGVAGQRRASGIARAGGDGAEEIAQFLEQRQLGQPERVSGFVDDAFETRGTTAARARDALSAERSASASAAYDAARGNAAPVDVRGALGVIDQRIGGMQGSGIAGDSIDGKLSQFRSRLAGSGEGLGDDVVGAEMSDFDRVLGVKQDAQDAMGAAVRAGRNNEARELGKLVTELDSALEAASDSYRVANDGFREASRVIDSVDTGAQMASRGRAADNVPAFQAMTPDQQRAARIGYGDNVLNRLERQTAPTADRSKLFRSPKVEQESRAMAVNPDLFRRRVDREGDMWQTQNRALGGSRTADNLQDIEDSGIIADAAQTARDTLVGNFGNAIAGAGSAVARKATGMNEGTRAILAQMLMSPNPQQVLNQAVQSNQVSAAQRQLIEALLRGGTRPAY